MIWEEMCNGAGIELCTIPERVPLCRLMTQSRHGAKPLGADRDKSEEIILLPEEAPRRRRKKYSRRKSRTRQQAPLNLAARYQGRWIIGILSLWGVYMQWPQMD